MITDSRQSGTRWMVAFPFFLCGSLLAKAALAQPDLIISNLAPGDSDLRPRIRPFAPVEYSVEGLRPAYTVQNQGTTPSGSFQVAIHASCRPQPPIFGRVGGGPPTFNEGSLPAGAARTTLTDISLRPGSACTVRVTADPSNAVKESNEANNELTQSLNLPEVTIKNVNVHRNNQLDTYLTFDVKNTGPVLFAPTLRVEKLTGTAGGLQELWSLKTGNIPVGEKYSFTVGTDALPAGHNALKIGTYYADTFPLNLKYVDYKKDRTGGLPDLKITDVRHHHNNERDVYITYKVKNAGSAASPAFTIDYESLGGTAPCAGPKPNPSPGLSPGEVRDYTIETACLAPGEHILNIYVDPASEIAEETFSNNWAEQRYKKR